MFDKIFAFLLILFLSPLFLIVTIIIYIDDGFPILFKQKRIGENNSYFYIYKFRTMIKKMKDVSTDNLKSQKSYLISSGSIIRKYSLDELPQLINILKGEMVFIGPRPALHNQENLKKIRTKMGVHMLKPGITGWAQINGRDKLNSQQKANMDYFYLINRSYWMDLKIIFFTIFKVIGTKNIKH